jgi:hypothetical protein
VTAVVKKSPLTGIPLLFDVKKGFLTGFFEVFDTFKEVFDRLTRDFLTG